MSHASKSNSSQLIASLRRLYDHAHICGFYTHPDERLETLAAYYQVGLERDELCIFVTKGRQKDLIKDLKQHGLDINDAVETGAFRIFSMKETYTPDNTFESPRMLQNLRNFVQQAKSLGYDSVRGGGDMDWLAKNAGGRKDVIDYESRINRFIRSTRFTGLCLFPSTMLNMEMTHKIIQTHQIMIRSSKLMDNPYYVPPEQFYKLDIKTVAEIETWLDELDDRDFKGALA